MSIFHPARVPAFFKIHTDPAANAENWAAVRLAATVIPPVFAGVALTIGLTYGGAGIPDPAPMQPTTMQATHATVAHPAWTGVAP